MSTRSLTRIKTPNGTLVAIYRQMDGYPTGMGADLKKILGKMKVGIGARKSPNYSNETGELAAKLIQKLKAANPSGNIYLTAPNATASGEDAQWEYEVTNPQPTLEKDVDVDVKVTDVTNNKVVFDGKIKDFNPKKAEEEAK